jgi:hypothetical protein
MSAIAVAPVLLLVALFALMFGLSTVSVQAAVLRAQLEYARASGDEETTRRLARQLTRQIPRNTLACIAAGLVFVALAVGMVLAPIPTLVLMTALTVGPLALILVVASLVDYLLAPLGRIARNILFGWQSQHALRTR